MFGPRYVDKHILSNLAAIILKSEERESFNKMRLSAPLIASVIPKGIVAWNSESRPRFQPFLRTGIINKSSCLLL